VSFLDRAGVLVWLRWRIWLHRLRTAAGVADLLAALLMTVLGVVGSLVIALALGFLSWVAAADGDRHAMGVMLHLDCWALFFFAVAMPLFVGGGRAGRDLAPLAVFPIRTDALYRLSLTASVASSHHFFWYPSLLVVTVVVVIAAALSPLPALAIMLTLAAVAVVWSDALLLLLSLVLRRRRVREVVVVIAFLLLIAVSVTPGVIESTRGKDELEALFEIESVPAAVGLALRLLPPSLAADGLTSLVSKSPWPVSWRLPTLAAWGVGGLFIGRRLFDRQLLEPASSGPAAGRRKAAAVSTRRSVIGRLLPPRLAAVVNKELRYLLRSTSGKLALAVAPMVAVFAGLMFAARAETGFYGIAPQRLVLFGVLLYVSLLVSNFLVNAYAWEGEGVACYFTSPVLPGTVVLGKNLGVWLFGGLLLLECLAVWCVTVGVPGLLDVVTGALCYASAVLILTLVGNQLSVLSPVRRSIASIKNSPSQIGIVLSLLSVAAGAAVMGTLLVVASVAGGPSLLPLAIGLFFAVLAAGYAALLRPSARLLHERREGLVAALEGEAE
jgi:hypothetical protein